MTAARDNMERTRILSLYRTMTRIRAFEKTPEAAQKEGHVSGAIHQSIGQEAIAAGVCATLTIRCVRPAGARLTTGRSSLPW